MAKKRICLDPGHYGSAYNKGAVQGYYESAIVWKLTMYEKEFLERMGIEVVLTRNSINENPELTTRGKKAKGCDLFVSNHTNACGTPSVTRAVCIYLTERNGTTIDKTSKLFAVKMAKTVDQAMGGIGHQVFSKLSDKDRDGNGKKDDNYYGVLHGAFTAGVPGVIVEHSFHTNANACKWLMDDKNLRHLAEECAKCMAAHVGVTESDDDIDASDYKELTREEILKEIGELLTADQKKSGILASVTGAQLILESDCLQSELAQNANNCFGMKEELSGNTWAGSVWDGATYTKKTSEYRNGKLAEIIASFRKYPNIEHSIADHSAYLCNAMKGDKKRYEGLIGCADHKKALQIIKDGGYATDPKYVEKLLGVIDDYDLKRFDCPVDVPVVEPEVAPTETVKVPFTIRLAAGVRYYDSPEANGRVNGRVKAGIYTIVAHRNGFGRLKSGVGWVRLNEGSVESDNAVVEAKKLPYTVRVTSTTLNVRKGPGTNYVKLSKPIDPGVYTIVEKSAGVGSNVGWGKLKSGIGWISLDHVTEV